MSSPAPELPQIPSGDIAPDLPWHQGRIPTPGQAGSALREVIPQLPSIVMNLAGNLPDIVMPAADREAGQ